MFLPPSDAFLRSRLRMLDLLLHREILRLRTGYRLSQDEFHGLYIGDRQVDALVGADAALNGQPTIEALTAEAERIRRESRRQEDESSRWPHVCERFALSPLERDILLLALAPETHAKYDTLFAYLHNDVSRKIPSCGLAVRVLADDAAGQARIRRALLPRSPLLTHGLLTTEPGANSLLSLSFRIAPEAAAYLLQLDDPPKPAARRWDQVPIPASLAEQLARTGQGSPPVVLETEDALAARLAAQAASGARGLPLHVLDAATVCGDAARLTEALRAFSFRLRLYGGAGLMEGCAALWGADGLPSPASSALASELEAMPGPVFLHFPPGATWRALLASLRLLHFALPEPAPEQRRAIWSRALHRLGETAPEELTAELASRFTMTAERIEIAAAAAVDRRSVQCPEAPLGFAAIAETVRSLSSQSMGKLANKIEPRRGWGDLVLPTATLGQLRDIAGAARHRHTVFGDWGLAAGSRRGVKALFSGASGTGKTMSAEVLANDLGLDLYQIDLSSIVSKYIGETEKNLDRVFRAARGINAILFFDEADALFGKRSEVKDAHDRYANIEVSYLLQEMEEFEGIAILATNLGHNLDIAFSRRLNFTVDFPLPDEALRLRLWQGMFPPQAPLSPAADLAFLARQFRFTGGDIRNVALAAAFLAAADGHVITMDMLIKTTARHLRKQGKTPSPGEFKQYHALVG